MKIGLVDVDSHNFPNLPLMKLSAWHKQRGDNVEWYSPLLSGHMDKVYMSKVFTFTDDFNWFIDTDELYKGGTGYAIKTVDGVEMFDRDLDIQLPDEIEHIRPDYSIYGIEDTAYGFLTRGCPRGCPFCHVGRKEGLRPRHVADLDEFYDGQKNLCLFDPNILASKDSVRLLTQIAETGATVDFNQGLDIRFMTEEKAEILNRIKLYTLHFAWDRYEDMKTVLPKLRMFRDYVSIQPRKVMVYVLCNYDTTFGQDLERIYKIREIGFSPYVMLYDKEHIPKGDRLKKLQRWTNAQQIFWKTERFEDYEG